MGFDRLGQHHFRTSTLLQFDLFPVGSSLEHCHFRKYHVERSTNRLEVPYYVKPDFLDIHNYMLNRLEKQMEEEYIANLRNNCSREKTYS